MKTEKISLDDLFVRDFPEFKNITGKLPSDKTIYDMLSEYARCKNVINKFLASDKRRNEYITIKEELRNEIRQRILKSFFQQN